MSSLSPAVRPSPSRLALPMLLAALGAILGATLAAPHAVDGWRWLHWVCKPLATALALVMAWRVANPVSARYRWRMLAGLAACLLGDVCLMVPGDLFVPGLVCFLLGHLAFIAAFTSDVRFAARPWPWLACLAVGALVAWRLWPALAPALRGPVLVYVAVLASMSGQALGRARWLGQRCAPGAAPARLAAAGGLLFMLSDALLAWDRFRGGVPWPALCVLATYYAALWLLARSVDRTAGAGGLAEPR
jgi:uncharacterized membrane protein YhhN